MAKRMSLMVLLIIIVFGSLLGFYFVKKYRTAQYLKHFSIPAVTISTVTAKSQTWHSMLTSVGNFKAINGVDVNAQTSGNVTHIYFESGQFVKKNTPLINIDDSIDQASLKNAKANLQLQRINYKRQSNLLKKQATSSSNVDTAKANLDQAIASVEKIEAEIAQKHIKAPFTGKLGVRLVNLGQYINPGSTKIVTLQSLDPLYLEFYLPEHFSKKLHKGQAIRFSVDAYPHHLFSGKVTAVNSKIDETTHNILVQATLPNCSISTITSNPKATRYDAFSQQNVTFCGESNQSDNGKDDYVFMPGMFAKLDVILPSEVNVVVLPRTAITYSLYGNSVFVVKDEFDKKANKKITRAYQQFVSTGEERGNFVVVKKGVNPGDKIVNSGQLKLHNGTPVNINNRVKQKAVKNIDSLGQ